MQQVERQVATSAGYVAVTERGRSDDPPVVLIHGYPDRASLWDEVAADLARDHHVIAYDVRGAGSSPPPATTSGYALPHLLADLAAVLDATVGDRPVHLVGHDWGAIQGFAATGDPELRHRLASFTAISAPGLDVARAWVGRRLAARAPRDLVALARQAGRAWYVAAFQVPVVPELVMGVAPVAWWCAGPGTPDRPRRSPPTPPPGSGCTGPNRGASHAGGARPAAGLRVRVLTGRDDPVVSPDLYESLRTAGTEVVELDGGHWLPLTASGRVADEVRRTVASTS